MKDFKRTSSIGTKVHIPLISSMVVGFIIVAATAYLSIGKIKDDVYVKEKVEMSNYLKDALSEKYAVGLTNAIMLSKNSIFKEALLTKDRELALDEALFYMKTFKEDTKFKNIKIHIHTADVHSFLRAWKPTKYGDDLSAFRKTIVEVKNSKSPLVAIEVGKAGVTVRGVATIFKEDKYIGSVEFMQGFNSVVKGIKKSIHSSGLVLLAKDMEGIASFYHDKEVMRVAGMIVAQRDRTIDKKLVAELKNAKLRELNEGLTTKSYFVRTFPLKDFEGHNVAYFVIAKKLSDVERTVDITVNSMITQLAVMSIIDV